MMPPFMNMNMNMNYMNPIIQRQLSGEDDNNNPFNDELSPLENLQFLLGNSFRGMVVPRNIDEMGYDELLREFPHQPRGARQEDIERLPTSKYQAKKEEQLINNVKNDDKKPNVQKDENSSCCICLEDFKEGDNIRRLPCLHIFHRDEIDQWLQRNHKCPICRTEIDR